MDVLKYAIVIVAGYLLGSLSASVLLSKAGWGRDVRKHGSGNAGATNMARVFGLGAGFATLAGDMLKAAAAMYLGMKLLGDAGIAAGGIACVLGHCFPVFHEFHGGKGISVGLGAGLGLSWPVALLAFAVFLMVAIPSKYVSLGSICAAVALPTWGFVLGFTPQALAPTIAVCIMVIWSHRANIERLRTGTERKFTLHKKS